MRLSADELRERAVAARAALADCNLCSCRCGVNRLDGQRGVCGLDGGAYWFREILNPYPEEELAPVHAIYMTGCNMRCAFCSVGEWVEEPRAGRTWDPEAMVEIVRRRKAEGARTLMFVGGDPVVNLPAILDLLARLPTETRVVWDTNLLMTAEARDLVRGAVDVYVADLKFGGQACATRLARTPDYLETLEENLHFVEETASLIVRHLLLPGHYDCCFRPALAWLAERLPRARVSVRREYLPPKRPLGPHAPEGYVPISDHQRARDAVLACGLEYVP